VAHVRTSLTIRQSKGMRLACRLIYLNKFNPENFVGFAAAGCVDLDAVANLFTDQRTGNRRGDGDFTSFDIGFIFADNLIVVSTSVSSSTNSTVAPNFTVLPLKRGDVNNLGPIEHVLKLHHPALIMALLFFGGVIFGVFRQVAMRARFGNGADDALAVWALSFFNLGVQRLIAAWPSLVRFP
jgi:hypothetical protein